MALISTASFGELDEVEIQRYLNRVNKPAIKSIKSLDGDIIDCIDMYKQPAFDHPLMKNHTIRYAVIQSKNVGKYVGAEANMNLWKPHVAHAEEFSLAQMWLVANEQSTTDQNTIEVGWQAYPRLYGDYNPRLFIFWTSKSYRNGCYNLQCEDFVQKSGITVVGAALEQVSTYNVQMAYLFVTVRKDFTSGDLWLIINGTPVGYWPRALFTSMQNFAERVDFGGEIVNAKIIAGEHTEAGMGSGHYSWEGYGKACSMDQIHVYDERHIMTEPYITNIFMTNRHCYDLYAGTNNLATFC
ncbi:PREDICTED: uncharacterized protein LOC104804748 [Tarenaya hassleriana]|uniref:uncharacterized protein LOC104804748 n=1 Tax=Tarenaya hassleriana TaxID=28532 RepID=UPI00053CA7D9|nr:PREDICTED: uncharacterized protein LOC104804748 [Tarenaya hassleriana]